MKTRLFKNKALILTLLISFFTPPHSKAEGNTSEKITSLFPHWRISSIAEGELNGDGISDVAVILVNPKEDSESAKLVVYFADRSGKLK